MKSIIALFSLIALARGQFHGNVYNFVSDHAALQQPAVAFPVSSPTFESVAHPAVLANAAMEEHLPEELKNNPYKNPSVAAGLAKESWFGDKEMAVGHRDADDVPRSEIFRIFERAGFNQQH